MLSRSFGLTVVGSACTAPAKMTSCSMSAGAVISPRASFARNASAFPVDWRKAGPALLFTFGHFVGTKTCAPRGVPRAAGKENSGKFQMPRFYFHMHLNGHTVPDRRGASLRNENDACAH